MLHAIGFIVTGFIVGLIARALFPGRNDLSMLKTTLLGIIGSVVAGWFGRAVGWYGPEDGAGFISSTIGALVVLAIYIRATKTTALGSVTKDREYPRRVA